MIDNELVGKQIASLRLNKGITQSELGERLNVSFQAVSKWERGETLPDVGILTELADILETTVDNILRGGVASLNFRGKIKVSDMIEGINSLKRMGELLGKDNQIYLSAVEGVNKNLNTDIEEAFSDDYVFQAFVAEAVIGNIVQGKYVDVTDIKRNFKHEHFCTIVCDYAAKHNMI